MVVALESYKIAYMPVPKAACSSVKEALARIDPQVQVPARVRTTTWHDIYPTRRFRPHRWEAYGNHWRFCVLRDPLQRLFSVYSNRIGQMNELRNSRRLKTDPRFADLPREPDPDTFFQNLQRYRAASSVIRHHAFPCWLFTGPDLSRFDAVYRCEELSLLASALSLRSGQRVLIPRRNRSSQILTLEDVKPATRDALRAALSEEYQYLSEFYENPFGASLMSLAR